MLTQKLVLSYFSKILIQAFQMIAMIIVARIVGPGVLGILAFGLAFVSMFLFIADFGISSAHIKLVSEGQDEKKCVETFSFMKAILIGVYALVVTLYFLIQKYILNIPFESSEHESVVILYLIITVVSQFFTIPNTTFAAKTQQARQDIPNLIQVFLYQVLRVAAAIVGLKAIGLAVSNLVAVILVVPIYFYLFRGYSLFKFDRALAKKYLKISIPLLVILIVQTLIYSTDRVILQYMTNSEEVGYYAAGYSLSQFIKLIEGSVGLLFFPLFSNLLATGDYERLNANINKYERFNFGFILPIVAVVSICSDVIVRFLLGTKYMNSIPILGLINIAMYVSVLNLPYINLISGKGLFKESAIIHLICLVIFGISAYLFVSPEIMNLKAIGIAESLIVVNVFLGVIFYFYAKKKIPMITILKDKVIAIYGIGMSIIFFSVYYFLPGNYIIRLLAGIGFLILYFSLAFLTKGLRKEDLSILFEVINSKKLLKYIQSEIKNKKDE